MSLKVGTERQQTRQAISREARWGSRLISRSADITARVEKGSTDRLLLSVQLNKIIFCCACESSENISGFMVCH